MKGFNLPILIIVSFLSFSAMAQNKEMSQKYFNSAQTAIKQRDFAKSQELLERALYLAPDYFEARVALGDVFFITKQKEKAIEQYMMADSISSELFLKYKLANVYFSSADYMQAKEFYNLYISESKDQSKFVQKSKERILSCDFAVESMENPVDFNPINLGSKINTDGFEYNPVVSADGKKLIYTVIREKNGRREEDFFISHLKGSNWTNGVSLPGFINSNENEGAHCISMDGKFLYLTSCGREEGIGSCDIYVSVNQNGAWSQPFNLGRGINSRYWDAHPAISPDGKTLIFSSSRPGGKGGKDLWISKLVNSNWSIPKNISALNTDGDEVTPFLHADGETLYFSSDGHLGMGGTDFYMSKYNADSLNWSKPINLGYKINGPGDEYSLMVERNGKKAYFASDALDGYGKMDIYYFELNEKLRAKNTAYLKGSIKDAATKKDILNSSIKIYDLSSSKMLGSVFVENGQYQALLPTGKNYAAVIEASNYTLFSESFFFAEDTLKSYVEKDFLLSRVKVGKGFNLNNIFFESAKSDLLPESEFELNVLFSYLKNNPKYNIKVVGHTDSVGKDKDNQQLSVKRAEKVKAFLVERGISKSRIKTMGLGESKPLMKNDSEEGRRKNRRTEIIFY